MWLARLAGAVSYPGIKLRCTGQSAVRGSYTVKIGITQKKKHHVIVRGTPNSLLEGEPWGGVWLECMPIKWYGVAYEQKKWYGKCHTSHTTSAALANYVYIPFHLMISVPNL